MNTAEIIDRLRLEPLQGEGGWFRRTSIDEHSSAILFLLTTETISDVPGSFARRSVLHRLPGKEIWHFHAGAPVHFLILDPATGTASTPTLGADLDAGQSPQVIVTGGLWQGAWTEGPWGLVGTTMAPAYRDEDFVAANRADLIQQWPTHAALITDLT